MPCCDQAHTWLGSTGLFLNGTRLNDGFSQVVSGVAVLPRASCAATCGSFFFEVKSYLPRLGGPRRRRPSVRLVVPDRAGSGRESRRLRGWRRSRRGRWRSRGRWRKSALPAPGSRRSQRRSRTRSPRGRRPSRSSRGPGGASRARDARSSRRVFCHGLPFPPVNARRNDPSVDGPGPRSPITYVRRVTECGADAPVHKQNVEQKIRDMDDDRGCA